MDEATLPETEEPSPVIRRKLRKNWKRLAPLEGHTGRLFDTMQHTDNRTLIALKSGFTVDIVNADTKKIYVRNVPLRMLWHFCGVSVLDRFIPDRNGRPDRLKIPVKEAEKSGVARVMRYMRRACKAGSVRPTGELRVPPSLAAGIETIRACRVFGLHADADRIEDVIIDEWIGNEAWYMTDEHVELIWDGYHGSLRDTVFGDVIVWFVLTEVQDKSHPLAEEIRWMLDQDYYETLKARVTEEVQRKMWRLEDHDQFLGRCQWERAERMRKEEERADRLLRGYHQGPLPMSNEEQAAFHHGTSAKALGIEIMQAGLWDGTGVGALQDVPVRSLEHPRAGADTPVPKSLGRY